MKLNRLCRTTALGAFAALTAGQLQQVGASSHMDAPMITKDDPANTTDVYAFRTSRDGSEYLTVALAVYPHEIPNVGPNAYGFDDEVLYSIHVGTGEDVAAGKTTHRYDFEFTTTYASEATILQAYLGVVGADGSNQNKMQTYTVTRTIGDIGKDLGFGQTLTVPPNNQGIATPFYNQNDDGTMPQKEGVDTEAALDPYTAGGIMTLSDGYRSWAGQREDGFYGDIQSIFDLLALRSPGVDSQAGYNVHMVALEIPLSELGGDQQIVGVHASTSRPTIKLLRSGLDAPRTSRSWTQIARQGNPLINEAVVPIAFKDAYNRLTPETDVDLFTGDGSIGSGASGPELISLIDQLVFGDAPGGDDTGIPDDRLTNRSDLAGLLLPDTIKVDLSTPAVRLSGATDDEGFSRMSIYGGDTLPTQLTDGNPLELVGGDVVPGGWPNGRRFGDDVIDIAVATLVSDFRVSPPALELAPVAVGVDGVDGNDVSYNKVFPYAGTPHNGRTTSATASTPPNPVERIFGLTTGNSIVVFDAANPSAIIGGGTVSGLAAGDTLVGLDYQPATGNVILIGSLSNVYMLDDTLGSSFSATLLNTLSPTLEGTNFAFDFNPAFMSGAFARIITDTDDNRVISGTTGQYLDPVEKTDVFYAAGDPLEGTDPNIAGIGYDMSVPGATGTQQYGIDATEGVLVTVANNAGTLVTVGSLGLGTNLTNEIGFDIAGGSGTAYASVGAQLYTVDLGTGTATSVGAICCGAEIRDITAVPLN